MKLRELAKIGGTCEKMGIMKSCKPRIFCAEIGNLYGESAAYLKKCSPRMNMQTLADYALNYAIA